MMSWLMAKITGALLVIGAAIVTIFTVRRGAKKEERFNSRMKDIENANEISRRASDAGKRMRDNDDAGYRD